MSTLSNDQGRALEFITLLTLHREISKIRAARIVYNSSYDAAERAWNQMNQTQKSNFLKAAEAAIPVLFDFEPMILEDKDDTLDLLIQPDSQGEEGDVRDILLIRKNVQWEIGLSLKHNHFAVKHSRLAKSLDFGKKWYGIPCSNDYWNDIEPIFTYLEEKKRARILWRNIPDKGNGIYVPLLMAFMEEVIRSNDINPTVPRRMVEYLLGTYDFYKVIALDSEEATQILTFNLRGTLNRPSIAMRPKKIIPIVNLPTRIVNIGFKPGSTNTVELYMDAGWQFSFRIHSASTIVEPSLKFDIQIIGMPTTIFSVKRHWE